MWIVEEKRGVLLRLLIQPGGKKSEVMGLYSDRLKVRIAAPAIDGKANEALLVFLQKSLHIKKSDLELLRGDKSRSKDILVTGVTKEAILKALS